MKLNPKALRYMTSEEFRVLTAVEMGTKNHEIVPTSMIANIANLRAGGTHKLISELARNNLIARVQNAKYDGYRLTYGGYDFLALRAFSSRGTVISVGYQIGTGKESDVYITADESNVQNVLKIQRLGRISFRNIKNKRDYLQKRKSASWMYMSRLASIKEYAFMKVLYENGFPVPRPVDQNRHCVVMELVEGFPLYQVSEVHEPGKLYSELMDLIVRLAKSGLIHGDFNEFNIMINKKGEAILIDFPQMVSTCHRNAEYYFNRDVDCIRAFFRKRFNYVSNMYPRFSQLGSRDLNLDKVVAASGFTEKEQEELEDLLLQEGEDEDEELVTDEDELDGEDVKVEHVEDVDDNVNRVEHGDINVQVENLQISDIVEEEVLNNHEYQPFRDCSKVSKEVEEDDDAKDTQEEGKEEDGLMSVDEIRRRVKRSMQKSGSTSNKPSARNRTKNQGKYRKNKNLSAYE